MEIRLSADEFAAIRADVHELWRLRDEESRTGKAPFAIFDMEDRLGGYVWLLERIIIESHP